MIRFTAQLLLNKTSICPHPAYYRQGHEQIPTTVSHKTCFLWSHTADGTGYCSHLHVSLYYWREYAPWSCRQYMSVILAYSFQPLTFSLSWRLESHSLFPVIWYLGFVISSSVNHSQYRSYMYNVRQFPQYPWSNLIWASSFMYLLFM